MEEEVQTQEKPIPKEEIKHTRPRASIPITFEVIDFTTPKARVEEKCQDSKETKLDKMEVDMKEPVEEERKSTIDEKSQGVKRKHDAYDNLRKKENLKKAYRRRVAAYKRKFLGGDSDPNWHNVDRKEPIL